MDSDAWRIARLLWSPGRLAEAAVRAPGGVVLGAAVGAGGVEVGAVVWALVAPQTHWAWSWAAATESLVTAMVSGACIAWATAMVVGALLEWTARSEKDRAITRVVLLSPVPWVGPVLVWSVFAALAAAPPGWGWVPPPGWDGWPAVRVLGSGWWVLAILICHVWLLRHAAWRLDQLYSRGAIVCPGCGYDMMGLEDEERCPECGRVRGEG